MAHFLDRLVAHHFNKDFYLSEMIGLLPQAEMFKAENVYRYFHDGKSKFRTSEEGGYEVNLDQFPSVAPPFPVFFISGGPDNGLQGYTFRERGSLFISRSILESQYKPFLHILQNQQIWSSRLALQKAGVKWVLYAIPFFQIADSIFPPLICSVILVKENGEIFIGENQNPGTFMTVIDENFIPEFTQELKESNENISWLSTNMPVNAPHNYTNFTENLTGDDLAAANFLAKVSSLSEWPALLALSFLNCRNVEIVEHDPVTTRQLRKQSERRREKTGYGLIKFYTLEIELIKKILKDEGDSENKGIGVALHKCRGHFKDYRDSKGLYGKHKGLYWWDDQLRGDAGYGTVVKDYAIKGTL